MLARAPRFTKIAASTPRAFPWCTRSSRRRALPRPHPVTPADRAARRRSQWCPESDSPSELIGRAVDVAARPEDRLDRVLFTNRLVDDHYRFRLEPPRQVLLSDDLLILFVRFDRDHARSEFQEHGGLGAIICADIEYQIAWVEPLENVTIELHFTLEPTYQTLAGDAPLQVVRV
jgi:hypothetical protein